MVVEQINETPAPRSRRIPVQARSRRRVGAILDAAERLVVTQGVQDLTTRDIAREADVPVASLYQYFADKEDVLLALAERDMAEMDALVADRIAALEVLTVASVVEATLRAFVEVYHRRTAFVEIYLRGRTNLAVHTYGRAHNRKIAATLRAFAVGAGLTEESLTEDAAVLAVEVGDRIFQLAYERHDDGDPYLIDEGITMMTAYLERYATPEGLAGLPGLDQSAGVRP